MDAFISVSSKSINYLTTLGIRPVTIKGAENHVALITIITIVAIQFFKERIPRVVKSVVQELEGYGYGPMGIITHARTKGQN